MNSRRSRYVTESKDRCGPQEEERMTVRSCWESVKVEGANVFDKLQALVREGNVRRVIVSQRGRTIAEFPLTVGVVGAVFAPILAAIGAMVALVQDCTIHVEREASVASEPSVVVPAPK
jgi:hypothetical protein